MRKTPLLLVSLFLACASIAPAQRIYTVVDGSTVVYPDVEPIMINGRVMVPLRGVFEHMGAYVQWDATNNEVRVSDDGTMCILRIGSNVATVNGSVVTVDSPPIMYRGRTMVPLRFISETFGHDVFWNAPIRTVEITTIAAENTSPPTTGTLMTINRDTVIPFKLSTSLSSSTSKVGDRVTGTIDTKGEADYLGLPVGTQVIGRVSEVRAKTSGAPGILGVEFERVRLPNGNRYPLEGSLIGLDSDSIVNDNGTLRARSRSDSDDLKWVGYGAAAGVLVAIATDTNVLSDSLIGAALGYLFGRTQVDSRKYTNVSLKSGTAFGVRLDNDLQFRVTGP